MKRYERDTEVLSLEGAAALAWYQAVESAALPVPRDFDWQALAQGAALRTRLHVGDASIAWAHLSIAIFQRLVKQYPEKRLDLMEMTCRSGVIQIHGADTHDPLRNPTIVFEWFRTTRPVDLEGARELLRRLTDPMTLEFEEQVVKPLRDLKERLQVVRALADASPIPDDIRELNELWHDLP